MLSGAFFGSEVTHMYVDFENPQNIGHLFGVLPIAAFEDLKVYARRIGKAATDVRGVRKAPGVERVALPGEREAILSEERRRTGVPIASEVLDELRATGRELGGVATCTTRIRSPTRTPSRRERRRTAMA
jgi:LDH2 family malate/lactate/ureidoglycolate dehydrogenase